jgi:Protein of unknown function (DUF1800)
MRYYLDNWESMAPDSFNVGPFAPRRGIVNDVPNSIIPNGLQRLAHRLNENYGREIARSLLPALPMPACGSPAPG